MGHGVDNSFYRLEGVFTQVRIFDRFISSGDHAYKVGKAPHLFDLLDLLVEILQIKLVGLNLLLKLLSLRFIELFLSSFHKGDHISHSENSLGEAIGIERGESVQFRSEEHTSELQSRG